MNHSMNFVFQLLSELFCFLKKKNETNCLRKNKFNKKIILIEI